MFTILYYAFVVIKLFVQWWTPISSFDFSLWYAMLKINSTSEAVSDFSRSWRWGRFSFEALADAESRLLSIVRAKIVSTFVNVSYLCHFFLYLLPERCSSLSIFWRVNTKMWGFDLFRQEQMYRRALIFSNFCGENCRKFCVSEVPLFRNLQENCIRMNEFNTIIESSFMWNHYCSLYSRWHMKELTEN